jgi:uncharacterized protein (DUF2236 family)
MASYFDDGSMIREVHRERVMALSGGRSLLLMAAHPVAWQGFFRSTSSLHEPYERLARAAKVLQVITWGDRGRADRMCAHVRKAHRGAQGTLADGTSYRADDPELLLWVLSSIVDSALVVFERFVRPLDADERERYWQDWRLVGKLFAIPYKRSPRTFDDFRAYVDDMVAHELEVVPEARELSRKIVLDPPVPLRYRPLIEVANTVTAGMLPRRVREMYGLSWDPVREVGLRLNAEWSKRVLLPLLPDGLRLSPGARGAAAA